ncbi:MAG: SpoIIE family protein phosphatase [Candidatus Rokubacteria bacterium]|nr:SpoIIE family protein phosphatase [Candidatus Rokubacteria bacterium]
MADSESVAKILVVDDNSDNVELARAVVEAAGYAAVTASDGVEALERVRESLPDLILLDVMMPRLDGLGVLQALRENPATAQIPVIMLTAKAEVSDRVAGLQLGADDYLPKPFSTDELVARIQTLLRRSEKLRYLNPLMGVLGDWFSARGVERLSRELEVAREIQMSLLPKVPPPVHGVELGAVLYSSETVSGDFYDFLTMPDGTLGISVGDVSGKGIPAALLMIMVRTLFRVTAADGESPGKVLSRINRYLSRDIPPTMFVTMFFCVLGPGRQLIYGDAGHVKPVLLRPGQPPRPLEAEGMMLGILDDPEFDEGTIQLDPGDLLALYTDGVVESVGPDGRMLGIEGLGALLEANRDKPPQVMAEVIAGEIRKSPGPLRDDLTLLILRA